MPEEFDENLLQHLLGGKRARFRTQAKDRRRQWTELEGPDGLETEFQHLLWFFGERFSTIEEARLAEFDWSANHVSYDHLAQWITQGATRHDKRLVFALAAANITPEITARLWKSTARENVTVMQALLAQATTVSTIAQLIADGHLLSAS